MPIDPFGALQEFRLSTGKSSRLLGMGILPLQFKGDDSVESLGIVGDEVFDIRGLEGELQPRQDLVLAIQRRDGIHKEVTLQLRVDTPIEVDYLRHGGILPYVLRELLAEPTTAESGSSSVSVSRVSNPHRQPGMPGPWALRRANYNG